MTFEEILPGLKAKEKICNELVGEVAEKLCPTF